MSKDGFNANDIDSIVARSSKRRPIDDANLKRKTLETGALPSATHDCSSVIKGVLSIEPNADKPQEEYKSSLKYSWEKEGFFRHKDGFN